MKKYIWNIKGWIALRLFFNACYILAIAYIPYILKTALDYDYSQGYHDILYLVLLYIGIAVIGMVFQYLSQLSGWKSDQKFFLLIKHDLFCAIIKRKPKQFQQKHIQDYVSMMNNDIPTLQEYIESIIVIVESLTQIVIYAGYLLWLDYQVAFVIMISSGLCLFLPNITGKKLSRKRKGYLEYVSKYMNKISDLLAGFSNVNRITRKSFEEEEYNDLNSMEDSRLKYGRFRAFTIVLNGFCMYLLDITAFSAVVISLILKRISVGTATALLSYIKEFTFPIRSLVSAISSMKSTRSIKAGIFSILSYEESKATPIYQFNDSILYEDVTINFDDFHLENFTYRFRKGKKYAIIGHSGSGKSTLLHLLLQQEMLTSGKITIDDKEIDCLDHSHIIAHISQKEHIFKENFEKNATIFDSYPKNSISDILLFLNCKRLQTLVKKEDCSILSGGEKNLLSIVKVLIMDKDILLLDEIFSALDFNTKIYLQNKLYGGLNKTMLVVTHDITEENLKYFDEILILKAGKLIQSGRKEEVFLSKEYKALTQTIGG